jgi:hypothetical protein
MVADFMDHRPSPEGAPASPLWLRPTAALGQIKPLFQTWASFHGFSAASDEGRYVDFAPSVRRSSARAIAPSPFLAWLEGDSDKAVRAAGGADKNRCRAVPRA